MAPLPHENVVRPRHFLGGGSPTGFYVIACKSLRQPIKLNSTVQGRRRVQKMDVCTDDHMSYRAWPKLPGALTIMGLHRLDSGESLPVPAEARVVVETSPKTSPIAQILRQYGCSRHHQEGLDGSC